MHMENIINFLNKPRDTGLHILVYKIKLSKIAEFIDHVKENYSIEGQRTYDGSDIIKEFLNKDRGNEERRLENLSRNLSEAIAMIRMREDKPEIRNYFKISPEEFEKTQRGTDLNKLRRIQRLVLGFFDSKKFPEELEVLNMDYRISKDEENMLIELLSLKEIGFQIFSDFISCLPALNDSLEMVSQRKSHSEKYIFKLYVLVIKLWKDLEDKFLFNDNIKNFLDASIKYYDDGEWRTSILLSSLAMESIFAEIYEEEYKTNAPDIPLGGLIHEVEEKISFPSDLMDKIIALNKARIASVHRSENPVSDKDSIISMMGITSLIIWYFDKY